MFCVSFSQCRTCAGLQCVIGAFPGHTHRGGSRISGKWVHINNGVGVRFADFT